MERKLGEIQQINGKWYQLVKADKNNSCNGCSFFLSDNGKDCIIRCRNYGLIYKKLKIGGVPYSRDGKTYQAYIVPYTPYFYNGEYYVCQAFDSRYFIAEINKEDMKENEENNYLDKFKKLPHLGIDYDAKKLHGLPWGCKVIDDWGYAPNLYHFDTEWHVTWIHCSEGDGILDFHFSTPEECINKAYEFCIKNHLISE